MIVRACCCAFPSCCTATRKRPSHKESYPSYYKALAVLNLMHNPAHMPDYKLEAILRKLVHCEQSQELFDLRYF